MAARIKEQLLKDFNLHTVVRLGDGVLAPYTDIPSNLLFFEHEGPTEEIWFYEIPVPGDRKKYSKTKAIQTQEFEPAKQWWNNREKCDFAWKVKASEVIGKDDKGKGYDKGTCFTKLKGHSLHFSES